MRLWRESGCPERHRARAIERHEATGQWGEEYRKLRDGLASGPLIVLFGKRGTGKTQLAIGLMADVCLKTQKPVHYCKAMDLFREIRACYRKDGPDEVKTVDRFCGYACLVVDEAHERSDSEWENRTLTNIVDRRYDAMKTTILVSNLDRKSFGDALGPSIVSRIHEAGIVVDCNWSSFRGAK